ncbi:threo-3-hydroxy-L-aspartate ammonia-lyase [Gloeobacter kilaueensis]|uniref:threonine ammonia-lyase n=1 Tax=Gloeobacter kilaueensis (strain ATCC BAA-2537 / CCAP 1431/1 / ULC 316 / JS1) TaxID=1183438 RepID=U5QKY7_GLOK1|nr:threo-3-hydroxy-L-aspartate ammonia-lyase [Gloeobacter kilaueensis]AGY58305.1 serine/threonine dehydratase [Gloeobacter kilaueensis JS1]
MTTPGTLPVDYGDIEAAAHRLAGVAHRTPVLTSRTVDALSGAQVYFKCENFQRTGSFKFRGAYNALSQLTDEQRQRGVIAYSSGNHAQAVALAGQLLAIPTLIVMPEDAPRIKRWATEGYGAEVILYDRRRTTREAVAEKLIAERGTTLIPPFDHPQVVAGQGTAARELFSQAAPLDVLVVCCGGGGLLSGSAIAAHALAPTCRVIGAEPAQADDAARSFRTGVLHTVHNPDTIADGARTPSLGQITFALVRHYVHDIVTVEEAAIVRAMFFLWERLKIVVEPTGALATAALLEGKVARKGERVGVIVSGGNVDVGAMAGYADKSFLEGEPRG